ncbi:hypothetical protein HID58_022612 [Brassica napus]|uniref:Uncharacterized protein n=1 Tax=Brassica napus TaxID=3708 RepID=A0ABQ8CZV2_BRANA|nr:hypothetical protein HID58_022612 [Brassica napus]
MKRIRCLRIRFSSGENARSVKASAGRSSEGVEKTDSTGGGGARQFDGPVMEWTLKLERRRFLRISFSGGENARSIKASAGRSSEVMEKTDSTRGGGARQFAGPVMEVTTLDRGFANSITDEVVKLSPHAVAIRDVEDEELRSFFFGMSPWQGDLSDMLC